MAELGGGVVVGAEELGSTLDACVVSDLVDDRRGRHPAGVDADERLRVGTAAMIDRDDPTVVGGVLVRADAKHRAKRPGHRQEEAAGRALPRGGGGLSATSAGVAQALPVGRVVAPDDGQDATPAQPELPQRYCILLLVAGRFVPLLEPDVVLGRGQQVADTEITGPQPLAPRQPPGARRCACPGRRTASSTVMVRSAARERASRTTAIRCSRA